MNIPKITQGMRLPFFRSGQPQPGDPSPFSATDLNAMVATLNAFLNAQIRRGASDAVYISDANAVFQFKTSTVEGSAPIVVTRFRIKSIAANHIVCRAWDGTTEDSTDVLIAKQPNARTSIVSETISGLAWAATYSDNNTRTLTHNAAIDRIMGQRLYAPYAVNGEVIGVQVTGGTGVSTAPEWIELLPARRWEIDLLEFDVCVDGEDMKAMFPATQPYEP